MASSESNKEPMMVQLPGKESGYASAPPTPSADLSIKGNPVDIVRWNYIHLKEGMCYYTIVDKLISTFCLSDEDRQVIEQVNSNHHKCERLLKCLLRKENSFRYCEDFLKKLKECNTHCHLYKSLVPKPSTRTSRTFHVSGTELRKIRKSLVEDLEPKIISDKLFAKHVLSDAEHDNVLEERTRSRQAHRILFILEDKSQEELDTFLDILDESNLSVKDMLKGHKQAAPQKVHKAVSVIRQSFRYVKEKTCPYCELMIDFLIQNDTITDTDRRYITDIDRRKEMLRCSKLTKIVIQKGKNQCKIFLQAYETPQLDSKFIVDEMNTRFERRKNSRVPRTPQASLQIAVLRSHYGYLLEELQVQPLLDVLFEESLIEVTDHDKVEDERRRADQIRILLSKIEKLDGQKFSYFVWVLEKNGYLDIIEGLKDTNNADSQQDDTCTMLDAVVDDGVIHFQQRGRIADGRYKLKLSARGGNDVLRQAVEHSVKDAVEHSMGFTAVTMVSGAWGQQASGSQHHSTMQSDHRVSRTAVEHSEVDINELCLKFSSMVIDDVTEGSVIIHVHPVTDNALQKLLDAKKNGSLREFITSLLSKNKLNEEFAGQEVHFDVELVKDPERSSPRRTEKLDTRKLLQRIQEHMEDLKEEIEPSQMAKLLIKRKKLSESECSDIVSGKMSRRERVEKLLRLLMPKIEASELDIEEDFVDVLKEFGYTHVLDLLHVQSEEKHQHAEQVRQGIIEHYSDLLDELGPNLINQMLRRRSIPESMREKLVPKGGKRRKVVVNKFLKEILSDDILVCEFEEYMTEIGMEEFIKSSVPMKQTDMTEASGEIDVTEILLSASFKIKFRRKGEEEIDKPLKKEFTFMMEGAQRKEELARHHPTAEPSLQTSRYFGTSWSQKRNIVAAIDFGTAFSGAAFSFKTRMDNIVVVNKKVQSAAKYMSEKVPTALFLGPDGETLFGWEAQQRYKELTEDEANQDCYYFKRFKMDLLKTDDLTRDSVVRDVNGLSMAAMRVFQLAIACLKDRVIDGVRKSGPEFKEAQEGDIFWVITVPAIWGDKAKQFMREAAQGAGIRPEQLTFALEPEAAALFIRNSQIERKDDRLDKFAVGKKFLVVDLGGGTGDLTSMQVTENLSLRQLHRSCGGDWGGESINITFWEILNKIFGTDMIEEFKHKYLSDYLELEDAFESKKRLITDFREIQISLPQSLIDMTQEKCQKSVEDLLVYKRMTDVACVRGRNRLSLSQSTMESLFRTTVCRLIEEMRQFIEEDMKIILVGGFSNSKIIQDVVRKEYGSRDVIIHPESDLAVLKGAVYYGHEPASICSRVCKFTYGLEVQRYFLKGDPEELKTHVDGHPYCTKVFAKIVTIGEEIGIGIGRASEEISPLSKHATSMTMKIYKSTQRNPRYVTESGCDHVGQIKVETLQKQEIKVWMKFGEAELIVEGRDAGTGELVEGAATLDLLAS